MTTTNENHLTAAALRYLRECFHFKNETGLNPKKADEILSMIIANRWLKRHGLDWQIEISSKPRGVDGTIAGEFSGPRSVEFKSSTSKNPSYWFKPDFDYASHGCLVFTKLLDGVPNQVILAIGEKSIAAIKNMADLDTQRLNFQSGHMALVHATGKSRSEQRKDDVPGLLDLVGDFTPERKDDCVVLINSAQLAELMAQ